MSTDPTPIPADGTYVAHQGCSHPLNDHGSSGCTATDCHCYANVKVLAARVPARQLLTEGDSDAS